MNSYRKKLTLSIEPTNDILSKKHNDDNNDDDTDDDNDDDDDDDADDDTDDGNDHKNDSCIKNQWKSMDISLSGPDRSSYKGCGHVA